MAWALSCLLADFRSQGRVLCLLLAETASSSRHLEADAQCQLAGPVSGCRYLPGGARAHPTTPSKRKDILALRVRLQMEARLRELAPSNLGIESKLSHDLVRPIDHSEEPWCGRSAPANSAACANRPLLKKCRLAPQGVTPTKAPIPARLTVRWSHSRIVVSGPGRLPPAQSN